MTNKLPSTGNYDNSLIMLRTTTLVQDVMALVAIAF